MSRRRHRHPRYSPSSPYAAYADDFEDELDHELIVRRGPSPGIAAVLSVLIPGLGQVYNGQLLGGAVWFLATSLAYWAILVPGFLVHAFCVYSAYRGAERW